jgi:MarR family transcriptional regulator, organic hydroperoxide resistance regulator
MTQREASSQVVPSEIHARDLELALANAVGRLSDDVDPLIVKAATNLKRAATVLDQIEIWNLHSSTGRTTSAFRVLVMVWAFGPMEAKDVARLSGVSRQAVSSVLATLERDGLVARERATKADKRLAPVTVSESGRELVENFLVPQNKIQRSYFEVLSRSEIETLLDLLSRLIVARRD